MAGKVVSRLLCRLKELNWKYAAAACLLLLAGSVYLNVSLCKSKN